MDDPLGMLEVVRRSGTEKFRTGADELDFDLLSFWQWSCSDLLSNATRGVVAEFLVARALGIAADGVRHEWAAYDLETKEGVTVEVKSAAYLQRWRQDQLSRISFVVPKTRAWDPRTNRLSEEIARQAQVYVFALLAHQDKATVDPLDLRQWIFYVLPTAVLNNRTRSQHSITLRTLHEVSSGPVAYGDLREAVVQAAKATTEPANPCSAPDSQPASRADCR
jgi:hypothetical protein